MVVVVVVVVVDSTTVTGVLASLLLDWPVLAEADLCDALSEVPEALGLLDVELSAGVAKEGRATDRKDPASVNTSARLANDMAVDGLSDRIMLTPCICPDTLAILP